MTFSDASIAIKGNADSIQRVADCNTAVFELIISVFQSSLQDQHLYVSRKMNKDKNIVATTFTVINRKRTVLVDDEELPLLQRQRSQMMYLYAEEVISQR